MSPPPGRSDEYSRGDGASGADPGRARSAGALRSAGVLGTFLTGWQWPREPISFSRAVAASILLGALAGATILAVSEFLTLYTVHVANHSAAVLSVRAGSDNSYALIPVAVLAGVAGVAAMLGGGRAALLSLGLAGIIALLIGLLVDLPASQQANHLIRWGGKLTLGGSSPTTAMYLETVGAVLLIATAGLGLLAARPEAGWGRRGAGGSPRPAGG